MTTTAGRFGCDTCADYLARRKQVLAPHLEARAFIRGVRTEVVAWEFMHGLHLRHLAGKSLTTDAGAA